MARTFKFTLRVKDCKQEFKEGMGEGVLVSQEVVYRTAPVENTPLFVNTLLRQREAMVENHIEVQIEEIE